ncbi:hypothetical protein ACTU44_11930 [Thalassospira sp. SM2505]
MTNSAGGISQAEAVKISEVLYAASDQKMPHEIMCLDRDAGLWAIVFDIDGIDYLVSLSQVPSQRQRPEVN